MGRRNKLEKFVELRSFTNVYQNYDYLQPRLVWTEAQEVVRKGRWAADHFGNELPITLELACGGGEYTLGMAHMHPRRNFIGVDIKGNRIWKGARKALELGLGNAAFLRTRIEQIDLFFAPDEIDQIWITFPDPFPRKSKANRRLTNVNFLNRYRRILRPGGTLHLKTDALPYFDFSLEVLNAELHWEVKLVARDIYADKLLVPELELKTHYEQMHLAEGKTINYLQAVVRD